MPGINTEFLETVISSSHVGNCVLLTDLTDKLIFQLIFNLHTYKHECTLMQDMLLRLQESDRV